MSSISSVHFMSQFWLASGAQCGFCIGQHRYNPILSFERETKDLKNLLRDFPVTIPFETWLCT